MLLAPGTLAPVGDISNRHLPILLFSMHYPKQLHLIPSLEVSRLTVANQFMHLFNLIGYCQGVWLTVSSTQPLELRPRHCHDSSTPDIWAQTMPDWTASEAVRADFRSCTGGFRSCLGWLQKLVWVILEAVRAALEAVWAALEAVWAALEAAWAALEAVWAALEAVWATLEASLSGFKS